MMLAVENWETGSLEVAMLLDESPNRHYLRGAIGGAPWRPDGPLAAAARSADVYGYAWLTIVFKKDDVRTWGQKRVKLVTGGRLYTPVRTKSGVETGEFRELGYETLAQEIFENMYGQASTLQYLVLQSAEMTLDPEIENDLGTPHPLLGYREEQDAKQTTPSTSGKYVRGDLGCKIVWTDWKQYSETWFLTDAEGFARYRFELTEHQRRPFVRDILCRLGFVRRHTDDSKAMLENRTKNQMRGHMQNVSESLRAVAAMLADQGRAPADAGRAHMRKKEGVASSNPVANGAAKQGRSSSTNSAGTQRVNAAAVTRNVMKENEVVVLDIQDSDVEGASGCDSEMDDTMDGVKSAAPDYMAQFEPSGR